MTSGTPINSCVTVKSEWVDRSNSAQYVCDTINSGFAMIEASKFSSVYKWNIYVDTGIYNVSKALVAEPSTSLFSYLFLNVTLKGKGIEDTTIMHTLTSCEFNYYGAFINAGNTLSHNIDYYVWLSDFAYVGMYNRTVSKQYFAKIEYVNTFGMSNLVINMENLYQYPNDSLVDDYLYLYSNIAHALYLVHAYRSNSFTAENLQIYDVDVGSVIMTTILFDLNLMGPIVMKNIFFTHIPQNVSTKIKGEFEPEDTNSVYFCNIVDTTDDILIENVTIRDIKTLYRLFYINFIRPAPSNVSVYLENIVLENIYAAGIFVIDGFCDGCNFHINHVYVNGHGKSISSYLIFYEESWTSSPFNVQNSIFSNFVLTKSSAIVFTIYSFSRENKILLQNVSFTNLSSTNGASSNGYLIYIARNKNNVLIDNCTFENNKNMVLIGCAAKSKCNVTINNSIFKSNIGANFSGMYHVHGATVNCNINTIE